MDGENNMNPAIYIGDNTVLTKLKYGQKIFVNTRDLSLAPHLMLDGYWEDWVSKMFLDLITPGMTVLDIGANCGYYSLLAASRVGPSGYVHAFEPNPFHHKNMIKSFNINGFNNVMLHKVALSDREGMVTLYVPPELSGDASLLNLNPGEIHQEISVNTVKLDEYLPDTIPDVIKIDIEGAEPLIIDSMLSITRRNPKPVEIIMEYYPKRWKTKPETVLKKFIENGFCIHVIDHSSKLIPVCVEDILFNAEQLSDGTGYLDLKFGRGCL
jgi:FkbM family methyltransferase